MSGREAPERVSATVERRGRLRTAVPEHPIELRPGDEAMVTFTETGAYYDIYRAPWWKRALTIVRAKARGQHGPDLRVDPPA